MSFLDSLNSVDNPIVSIDNTSNNNAYLEKLIGEVFKTDNITIRSDLNKDQILVFAKAQLYSNFYGVKIIDDLLVNYMTLSLSKNRSSRKELVEIAKGMHRDSQEPSITEKLLGK